MPKKFKYDVPTVVEGLRAAFERDNDELLQEVLRFSTGKIKTTEESVKGLRGKYNVLHSPRIDVGSTDRSLREHKEQSRRACFQDRGSVQEPIRS